MNNWVSENSLQDHIVLYRLFLLCTHENHFYRMILEFCKRYSDHTHHLTHPLTPTTSRSFLCLSPKLGIFTSNSHATKLMLLDKDHPHQTEQNHQSSIHLYRKLIFLLQEHTNSKILLSQGWKFLITCILVLECGLLNLKIV